MTICFIFCSVSVKPKKKHNIRVRWLIILLTDMCQYYVTTENDLKVFLVVNGYYAPRPKCFTIA